MRNCSSRRLRPAGSRSWWLTVKARGLPACTPPSIGSGQGMRSSTRPAPRCGRGHLAGSVSPGGVLELLRRAGAPRRWRPSWPPLRLYLHLVEGVSRRAPPADLSTPQPLLHGNALVGAVDYAINGMTAALSGAEPAIVRCSPRRRGTRNGAGADHSHTNGSGEPRWPVTRPANAPPNVLLGTVSGGRAARYCAVSGGLPRETASKGRAG
jgi:hypothetical protein